MNVQEHAQEIIKMYTEDNLNTVEISRIIGCSDSAVSRLLKRNNIEKIIHRPNELKLSNEDINSICDLYIQNYTTVEIGDMYNLSDITIAKILRNNNIEIRKAIRRSLVKNHDYFNVIDSKDKAYFLGWMISDGSVIRSKARPDRSLVISIELKTDDKYILDMFAEAIDAEQDIVKSYEQRNHSHLRFASEQMANDLSKYGVIPNKTWISYLPILDDEYMPHLIRGIFDGDGTITIDKNNVKHFAFYGAEQLCLDMRDYLHNAIGLSLNKVSKSTCYHVWWGGEKNSKLFSDYIYKDCDKYVLKRKMDRFLL